PRRTTNDSATPVQGPLRLNVCPSILIRTRIRTVPRQRRQNSTMELDEPYHEALDAQQNNEGQSQQANQTLPGANIEITTLQMMQQMMKQISELTARIAKIETTSTPTPAEPTPTPAVDATPPPAMPAPPHEPKGLKDPDAFDGTRSQYLPWKYQIKAKLRSEPRRFHTSQLAIDYTFSRTTGDARAR
ncbi:hypothetical protein Alg130_12340, partial [Pyrenophora tritici-repentis]